METKKLAEKMQEARLGFGLSTLQIGKILGLGTNQWRGYENGAIPNKSKENLIRIALTPSGMMGLLNHCPNIKNEKWFQKLYFKVQGMNFEIDRELQKSKEMMNENWWITHPPIPDKIKFKSKK